MKAKKTTLLGIHYATRDVIRMELNKGMISGLTVVEEGARSGSEQAGELPVVAPGLTELQINGYMGVDFNGDKLDADQVEILSSKLVRTGVTRYYPTFITSSPEIISKRIRTVKEAVGQGGLASRMIGGIHVEGPFISKEDGPRGAHAKKYCIDPDPELVKAWQDEAGGLIRILTLAPELPGSVNLIKTCVEMGIVVSIGHTAAGSDDIRRAADAGARLSTHLGNGSHNMIPRHPNYIWDQLAEERLYTTMIADGVHLPDNVLKVFFTVKKDKSILISDGMPLTGLEPGIYDFPATGKVCLTSDQKIYLVESPETYAGSASVVLDGVKRMSGIAGFTAAWEMASCNPRTLMDGTAQKGLYEGAPADLVILDPGTDQLQIRQVYKDGVPGF